MKAYEGFLSFMKIEWRAENCCWDYKDFLQKKPQLQAGVFNQLANTSYGKYIYPDSEFKSFAYEKVQKLKKRYLEETIRFTPLYEDNIFHLSIPLF